MRTSLFKANCSPRERLRRLTRKLFGNPFLPLLAWSKVVEATFTPVPLLPSIGAALLLTVIWVFGEDAIEYAQDAVDD